MHRPVWGVKMKRLKQFISLAVAAELAVSLAQAQEAPRDDLTSMLPCEGRCAVTTRPQNISHPFPDFPDRYLRGNTAEALIEISFTVLPDGSVAEEMDVERVLGPAGFVESAKAALRKWKYKPATLEGQPVASKGTLRTTFSLGG